MWFDESVFYQIDPLGFCGAPAQNDGVTEERIVKVADWIPHFQKLNVDAVYLGPVFESDAHGYDTRDYGRIDCRLGSNEGFASLCNALHEGGIRVVLDGVFNHVGRGFWAFRDVCEKREASPYRDWFCLDFNRDSPYGDGFWYEGWEGHFELVKLNLGNPEVVAHLFECIGSWIKDFGIDGLRLDVAYMLDEDFLRALHTFVKAQKEDFFLLGEAIHGDYNRIVNGAMLDSCTNYECFKGIYSSFNDYNLFEIAHSLNRQFGPEDWTIYKGKHLFNFVDNHDVSRIATSLTESAHLRGAYAILFGMPGIPCIYYGSEWGAEGDKSIGDALLRPDFPAPIENELTAWIASLAGLRRGHPALLYGGYRQLYLTNKQFAFAREGEGDIVIVAVNAAGEPHTLELSEDLGGLIDLLTGETVAKPWTLPPYSAAFYTYST